MDEVRVPNTPISVIMPVHNGGVYLGTAVQSILDQKNVQLELILVDDHSTDTAVSELPADERLRIIHSQTLGIRPGIVHALNAGISAANYPLIARMDSDDLSEPNRLRTQLDYYCSHPDVDIVGAVVEIFKDDDTVGDGFNHYQTWLNTQRRPQQIEQQMFVECSLAHPTFFMSTSLIRSMGGYSDSAWPEDYDLIRRSDAQGAIFGKPDSEPLLRWRDHSNRLSRNDQRYDRNAFLECKAFYLANHLKQSKVKTVAIWGAGPTGLKLHDNLEKYGIGVSKFYDINPKLVDRCKRGKEVMVAKLPVTADFINSMDRPTLIAINARGAAQQMVELLAHYDMTPLKDFFQLS